MIRFLGKLLVCCGGLFFVAFGIFAILAFAGNITAAWAMGSMLINGRMLFAIFAGAVLVGLELLLLTRKIPSDNQPARAYQIFGGIFIALGLMAGTASFFLLTSLSVHSTNTIKIAAVLAIWLGFYLLRRFKPSVAAGALVERA